MVISFVFFFSCRTSNKQLNEEDIALIQSCIDNMVSETHVMDESYFINSFFSDFSFNKYTIDSKNQIFNILDWDENSFKIIKREVNNKYYNSNYDNLHKLSKGTKSNIVITFSGIHNKLILAEILHYDKQIGSKELVSDIHRAKIYQKDLLLFIFNDGKIREVLLDGNSFIKEVLY